MDLDKIFTDGLDYVTRAPSTRWSSTPATRENIVEDIIAGLRSFAESRGVDVATIEARLIEMRAMLESGGVRVPLALMAGEWDTPIDPREDFDAVLAASRDDV